jgi:TP901 family phage tail tape measure protein
MATLQSQLRLSLIDQVSARAKHINASLNSIKATQASMTGVFGRIAAFGATYFGVTKGIQATAGAAIDFESAFADVRKVVDATDEQFANMKNTIRQMSTELPMTATDIAALFAAAGESGIAANELKTFSEMAARVGIAFNVTSTEAGQSLAKLKEQLGLSVAETGLMADAINHLSNNMSSKASEVTDFMLRVGALAKVGGFAAEQTAALGSAMIAAGAQPEVAGTAMQNVVKALTRGQFAKKDQRDAAKALGLDLPTIAKQMQKDAPKALKSALAAIGKAPKEQHVALLSQFFGDEAKAFAPLIGNLELLDRSLGLVGDKTQYAGSAYREYVERANTTANVLQLLRNKFADLGISVGDRLLPVIREAALGIGSVIDSLGERAHIFSQIDAAVKGFAQGLGYDGGIRQIMEHLGDMLFGAADGSAAADKIGRVFVQFKEWGISIRELNDAIKANPIAQFLADLAPYAGQFIVWSIGIGLLAGTIRKLAAAVMFLSGASAAIGVIKTLGGLAGILGGETMPDAKKSSGAASTGKVASTGLAARMLGLARGAVYGMAAGGAWELFKQSKSGDTAYSRGQSLMPDPADAIHAVVSRISALNAMPTHPSAGVYAQLAMESARGLPRGSTTESQPGKTADDIGIVRIDSSSIAEMMRPQGTQDVRVTNQQPPHITVNSPVTIYEASNGQAVAGQVGDAIGEAVRSQLEASFSD